MAGTNWEAVTFDFWNTLVYELRGTLRGHRMEAWAGLLEEAGFSMERSLLDAKYDSTWDRYVTAWKADQQFQAVHAAEHIIEQLGFEVPVGVRTALIDAFAGAGEEAELHLAEGATECLTQLRGAGLALGVICDVGFTPSVTLRAHLERHGVLDLFDHFSFPDEVGHYKPSTVIFSHALAGLGGVDPRRSAHVGDIRRTDVAGARAMGMTAIRYRGISDDQTQAGPEGDLVIDHHDQLAAFFGRH